MASARFGPSTLVVDHTTVEEQPYAAVWLDGDGSYSIRHSTLVGGLGYEVAYPDGTTSLLHGDGVVATAGVTCWDGAAGLLLQGNTIRDAQRAGVLLDGSCAELADNLFVDSPTDLIWQDCDGVEEPVGLDALAVVDHCPAFAHQVAPLRFELYLEEPELLGQGSAARAPTSHGPAPVQPVLLAGPFGQVSVRGDLPPRKGIPLPLTSGP